MSEEASRQFSKKHAAILPILESSADMKALYLLLLKSSIVIDEKNNLILNYDNDFLSLLYNILSKGPNKSEFEVLGKYIKTIDNLIHLCRIGYPVMNFVFDD